MFLNESLIRTPQCGIVERIKKEVYSRQCAEDHEFPIRKTVPIAFESSMRTKNDVCTCKDSMFRQQHQEAEM